MNNDPDAQPAAPHQPIVTLPAGSAASAPYPSFDGQPSRIPLDPARPWLEAGRSTLAEAEHHTPPGLASRLSRIVASDTGYPAQLRADADAARRTAQLVEPLRARGWIIFHDRLLADSSLIIDTVLVGPPGLVLLDSVTLRPKQVSAPPDLTQHYARLAFAGRQLLEKSLQELRNWVLNYSSAVIEHGAIRPRTQEPFGPIPPGQLLGWLHTGIPSLAPLHITDLAHTVEPLLTPAPLPVS